MKTSINIFLLVAVSLSVIQIVNVWHLRGSFSDVFIFVERSFTGFIHYLCGGLLDPLEYLLDGLVRRIKRLVKLRDVQNLVNGALNGSAGAIMTGKEFISELSTLLVIAHQDMCNLLIRSLINLGSLQNNALKMNLQPVIPFLMDLIGNLDEALINILQDVKIMNLSIVSLRQLNRCLSEIDDVVRAFLNGSLGVQLAHAAWAIIDLGKAFYLQKSEDYDLLVSKLQEIVHLLPEAIEKLPENVKPSLTSLATCLKV